MQVLAIDVGTGTQDVFLFDSRLDIENGFKLILPSPTLMINRRLREATRQRKSVLLTGFTMGGGPSSWAAEEHARAGLQIFATPDAGRSFNDDLSRVEEIGIKIVSEDEGLKLFPEMVHIELKDFYLSEILDVFLKFGVSLKDLKAVAVAVFDHGAAPTEISDRKFRFDYLDACIRAKNSLSAFAYPASAIPESMTRLKAVAKSAPSLDVPLVVMDTAPAAVLGATFDPIVAARDRKIIVNIGNFHSLAFRLGAGGIEGIFEHHTGLLDKSKMESLISALANGSLKNEDVFNQSGHGALVYATDSLPMDHSDFNVVVTGPRRSMLTGSSLKPYFAVPFGDMMIAGCFGLLAATGEALPDFKDAIQFSLSNSGVKGTPPWELPL